MLWALKSSQNESLDRSWPRRDKRLLFLIGRFPVVQCTPQSARHEWIRLRWQKPIWGYVFWCWGRTKKSTIGGQAPCFTDHADARGRQVFQTAAAVAQTHSRERSPFTAAGRLRRNDVPDAGASVEQWIGFWPNKCKCFSHKLRRLSNSNPVPDFRCTEPMVSGPKALHRRSWPSFEICVWRFCQRIQAYAHSSGIAKDVAREVFQTGVRKQAKNSLWSGGLSQVAIHKAIHCPSKASSMRSRYERWCGWLWFACGLAGDESPACRGMFWICLSAQEQCLNIYEAAVSVPALQQKL